MQTPPPQLHSTQKHLLFLLTLHHKIDYDGVKAQGVCGRTGVVPRILCFDGTQHQCAVGQDLLLAVSCHRDGGVLTDKAQAGYTC